MVARRWLRLLKTCCFTGHRPQSLPWGNREEDFRCHALKERLQKEIRRLHQEEGVQHFLSGMALGVDTWAAELVLEEKLYWPEIILECVIPCPEQAERWKSADRKRYVSILHRCDRKTVLQEFYSRDCFLLRNRYMVDNSQFVLAVWNGQSGGTGYTVDYARRRNRTMIILPPL
ncbi:DUF1273 family protein [Oscillibacter hominis]|uniref:DUF1273 family protein n=1 Tax=Oscillibacter hominis TaxID=2763056 RepID=A0A7G9B8N1_9FIRM|nr:SLOG family protein [Oscillibacter hominis]QNL45912.1 DUF1273 family protein [Oscillibacter hominis]